MIDDINPGGLFLHPGPVKDVTDVYIGDDAYPFSSKSIGEPTLDNCPACKGAGEISEFPADDDERLVACPTCGGTGEVYE